MAPRIVNDGAGGAVVAWTDRRSPGDDIYMERVNSTGGPSWSTPDGTPVCSAAGIQTLSGLLPDGTGGGIAVWEDHGPGSTPNDLYAQRLEGTGTVLWTPSTGVLVSGAAGSQSLPFIISDGASGAVVAWQDDRGGPGVPAAADVYAERLISGGLSVWAPNGTLVAAPGHAEQYPDIVFDGAGGAIVAWEDLRNCGDFDIYAQRVDASGGVSWQFGGVPICTSVGIQQSPKVCSDGSGGAIIAWSDGTYGSFDILAQRVDAGGTPLWATNGVFVCGDYPGQQTDPVITACEGGGALIAWEDKRGGALNIYLERITATGAVQPGWPLDGLSVTSTTARMGELNPQVISDGSNGAIVCWQDYRGGNSDIYVQRVDEFAVRRWAPDGVPLCTAISDQQYPRMVVDRTGGAIVTWQDFRAGNYDIAARRIDSAGTPLWSVDGVPICSETHTQSEPRIAQDGRNGAIITWRDDRAGNDDIYAQRVTTTGDPLWTSDGIVICDEPLAQLDPEITSDGALGAVIAWRDLRSGIDDDNIYAQRVGPTGSASCESGGAAVCVASGGQFSSAIAPDGVGGAILAWSDLRSARAQDMEIYAMRLAPGCGMFQTGVDLDPVPSLRNELGQNRPNPFNPWTTISYALSSEGRVTIRLFDVAGRLVKTLVDCVQSAGPHRIRWDGTTDAGRAMSGPYFYRVQYPDGTSSSKKMLLLR